MSEERFCPHCQKKLRSDNTKGMCGQCQQRGRTLDGSYGDARSAKPSTSAYEAKIARPPVKATAGAPFEVMARFRKVTETLGLDSEAILAEAAQGWLDGLRDALDGKNED